MHPLEEWVSCFHVLRPRHLHHVYHMLLFPEKRLPGSTVPLCDARKAELVNATVFSCMHVLSGLLVYHAQLQELPEGAQHVTTDQTHNQFTFASCVTLAAANTRLPRAPGASSNSVSASSLESKHSVGAMRKLAPSFSPAPTWQGCPHTWRTCVRTVINDGSMRRAERNRRSCRRDRWVRQEPW